MGLRASLGEFSTPVAFDSIIQYNSIKFSKSEFYELRDLYLVENPNQLLRESIVIWERLFDMVDGHPGLSAFSFKYLIRRLPGKFYYT